jgi:hypothetical protein
LGRRHRSANEAERDGQGGHQGKPAFHICPFVIQILVLVFRAHLGLQPSKPVVFPVNKFAAFRQSRTDFPHIAPHFSAKQNLNMVSG